MHSALRIPHSAMLRAFVLSWFVFLPAASGRAGDWPMFRGNPQLTGVAAAALMEPPKVAWKFEVEEPFESSAAIVNGKVYVGCDDHQLYVLDLASGELLWKFEAQGPIKSSPLVLDGMVYFGDDEGVLYALDATEGRSTIAAPQAGSRRSNREPTTQDVGRLTTTTSAPADPRLLWSFQTEGQIISSPNHSARRIMFGSYDGHLYCLDARDGKQVWKHQTEDRLHGTPGIAGERVLIAGCDQRMHLVDIGSGKPVGEVPLGAVSGGSAAISGTRVYVGTYGNQVLGLDWSRQEVIWTFMDPDRQFPFMGSAAVTPELVILGGRDKRLRAFAPDSGEVRWTVVAGGRIDSSPVVAGDRIWVGSSDGNLYALDLKAGTEKWRFESGAPISASPAIAEGRLVVGNEDGVLYCFAEETPSTHAVEDPPRRDPKKQ